MMIVHDCHKNQNLAEKYPFTAHILIEENSYIDGYLIDEDETDHVFNTIFNFVLLIHPLNYLQSLKHSPINPVPLFFH